MNELMFKGVQFILEGGILAAFLAAAVGVFGPYMGFVGPTSGGTMGYYILALLYFAVRLFVYLYNERVDR